MNPLSPSQTPVEKNQTSFWPELFKLILLSLLIVVPFRLYIAQPFIVEGASMSTTFETGDYLIVDELSYRFKTPERGSVLIFKYPSNPRKSFIKRIIGLPNETIIIARGQVTIINAEYPRGFSLDEPYAQSSQKDILNYTLGQDEYFVLGDNRPESADSRIWGPVPRANIIGRPIIRFFPPALWPGDESRESDRVANKN